jgi:hypothetical protein
MTDAPHDIEAHREAVLRRWADSPRHTWIGLHARAHAAVHDMEGIVLDADDNEVPWASNQVTVKFKRMSPFLRRLAHLTGEPPTPNRAQRRAELAKARWRA